MALGALNQVHVSTTDLDKAVAFYRDVLGIPLLFQVPGQPMAFFQSGTVWLYLGVPVSEEFTSHNVLYFAVDDIDVERRRLASRGVDIEEPRLVHRDGDTDLWMAAFRDPDGHQLVLSCSRQRSAIQ